MPYEWIDAPPAVPPAPVASASPVAELHIWPYRSLPKRGFVTFIAITCTLVLVPLLAVIGSPVLWGVLPYFAVTIWAVWAALSRSYRDGELLEELTIWPDRVALVRHNPRGPRQNWEDDPYWVRVTLHESRGPVPAYITLKGKGREIEIGAFLSEDERRSLAPELQRALAGTRAPDPV